MDLKRSPPSSQHPGTNQPDSEDENAYSEEESGGENGERPRKRVRRPMSVSLVNMSPSPLPAAAVEPDHLSPSIVQPEVAVLSGLEVLQDQNWLTTRRRCELCKQRKVCHLLKFMHSST
jgi:hypothetical protein